MGFLIWISLSREHHPTLGVSTLDIPRKAIIANQIIYLILSNKSFANQREHVNTWWKRSTSYQSTGEVCYLIACGRVHSPYTGSFCRPSLMRRHTTFQSKCPFVPDEWSCLRLPSDLYREKGVCRLSPCYFVNVEFGAFLSGKLYQWKFQTCAKRMKNEIGQKLAPTQKLRKVIDP